MGTLKNFGVMLEPQLGMSLEKLVETARYAEELGFGYLFRSDHLLPTDDRRGIDSVECWTSLGAIAAATSQIRFGPMVSPTGFHNPAVLGRMALTIHSYSGGRLQLGLGMGWYEPEYRANGLEFPRFSTRAGQFSEALEIIRSMMRQDRVDFDGRYYSAHTDVYPRPSGRVHLIIGGRSPRMVKLAAKHADEWNIFTRRPEDFERGKEVLRGTSGGRSIETSETGPFMLGKSEVELEKHAEKVIGEQSMKMSAADFVRQLRNSGSPCGTVDAFVDQMRKRADSGVGKFYFQILALEDRSLMELLADTLRQKL